MSELKTKLEEIKRQKDTYILPENLKKDVTVYGVTGTLESGSGDVKLFDTIEHMQQDENPQEGDLALVYRNGWQNVLDGIYIYKNNNWKLAPTQLTATPNYVYKQSFYGKNGVENGTLGTPNNLFDDTNAEVYNKIQNQYENMEPRILTDNDKTISKNIYFIPVKRDGTPLLDTSNVTNMSTMFRECTNLTVIPLLDTSNVTNMIGMFRECTNLTVIPLLDTSNVTNMIGMFHHCKNLTTMPLLDTSKVTNMNSMFNDCINLTTIPLLDTSSVTDMGSMFYECRNLTTIPLLDTSNVTDMYAMFIGCTNLTTISLLDTSKVTNMYLMFNGCKNLTDDSLNTIMKMCTNAVKITSNKTLKYIGLTQAQATTCQSLSNYQAFTNAGWTTGY